MSAVTREQVIARIREAGWKFDRHGKRVELWKKPGSAARLLIPTNRVYPGPLVGSILAQAGLTPQEIEHFLSCSVKS